MNPTYDPPQELKASECTSKVEKLSPTIVNLTVYIPYQKYTEFIDAELRRTHKNTKHNGFRPGKAPLSYTLAEKGSEIHHRALSDLFDHYVPIEIQKNKIRAITTLDMEIIPQVDSESNLESNPESNPSTLDKESIDRAPVDRTLVDREAVSSENKKQSKKPDQFVFSVKIETHPDLEPIKYLGLNLVRKTFQITEEMIDHAILLLLKRASPNAEVKDLTPEVLKSFDFEGSADDFRAMIKDDLTRDKTVQVQRLFEDEIIDKLLEANPVEEFPSNYVHRQVEKSKNHFIGEFKKFNLPKEIFEPYVKEQIALMGKDIIRRIHLGYIFHKLIEMSEISINVQDIEEFVSHKAAHSDRNFNPSSLKKVLFQSVESGTPDEELFQFKLFQQVTRFATIIEEPLEEQVPSSQIPELHTEGASDLPEDPLNEANS